MRCEVECSGYMNDCFVYEDWTRELKPRCFYVGMGLKKRVDLLIRNKHHTNIASKYGIDRKVVLGPVSRKEAAQHEVRLIAQRKTYVFGENFEFGANYTKGGERGTSGYRLSDSHRCAIRTANSKPVSDVTRARMKRAAKRRAGDPAWRELMSTVVRGRKHSESTKEKLRNINLGKRLSDKHKASISAGLRKNPNLGIQNRRENLSKERVQRLVEASSKPVLRCDDAGNVLERYDSINAAAKSLGVTGSAVSHASSGLTKTCCGWVWKFEG